MRDLAGKLRAQANAVLSGASRVASQVRGAEYRRPAADRFKNRMGRWQFGASGIAAQLNALADMLTTAASRVEIAQANRRRLEQKMREEAAERARRSGG